MPSRSRTLAVALAVVAVSAPIALHAWGASCPGVHTTGAWTRIDPPTDDYVVDPMPLPAVSPPVWPPVVPTMDPVQPPTVPGVSTATPPDTKVVPGGSRNRLFAYNGRRIFRSMNGGCSWSTVLDLDVLAHSSTDQTALLAAAGSAITDVQAPARTGSAKTDAVYALLPGTGIDNEPHPLFVATSTDGGTRWTFTRVATSSANGADPNAAGTMNKITELLVAPSDPRVAYVVAHETGFGDAPPLTIWMTRDTARTWSLGSDNLQRNGSWWTLAVDPRDANRLWWTTDNVVSTSSDGGRTFTLLKTPWGDKYIAGWPTLGAYRSAAGAPSVAYAALDDGGSAGARTGKVYRRQGDTWLPALPFPDADYSRLYTLGLFVPGGASRDIYLAVPPLNEKDPVLIHRWSAARGAWLPVRLPGEQQYSNVGDLREVDAAHRYLFLRSGATFLLDTAK